MPTQQKDGSTKRKRRPRFHITTNDEDNFQLTFDDVFLAFIRFITVWRFNYFLKTFTFRND